MNKNLFLPIFLIILFSGCHTIRPLSTADPDLLSLLPKLNHSIQLVLDKPYRNYASTDRGNALADPQTYQFDSHLNKIASVSAQGQQTSSLGLINPAKKSASALNLAIQNTLRDMIEKISEKILEHNKNQMTITRPIQKYETSNH